jgi:hypothetical protein
MSYSILVYNPKLEGLSDNNDFEEEEDEVDIDDEFEDIEEDDFEETDNSSSNETGA